MKLDLQTLRSAVASHAAAFRCITQLEPAGGQADKVFPPTYEGGKYATEAPVYIDTGDGRREVVRYGRVLLDSVQSQANRMELALLELWRRQQISLPVITVDFSENKLEKDLRVTSLEAPHRIADALLRDSLLSSGEAFRQSEIGKRLDRVDARNATALFELCPTALIFGMWDSTGPKGGLGAKFARAIVSEIMGMNAEPGQKTSSRIDPTQISINAGPLYEKVGADGIGWTLNADEAKKEKGSPVPYNRSGNEKGKPGNPSKANHGNVTPTLTPGGMTISGAVQTTVISLPALRRLSFPVKDSAANLSKQAELDDAARTALAALALCAATLVRENCDLRSRCQLFPKEAIAWEMLDKPGEPPKSFKLSSEEAVTLLKDAVAAAKEAGLPWMETELKLKPSPSLAELVRKSQELAAQSAGESADA